MPRRKPKRWTPPDNIRKAIEAARQEKEEMATDPETYDRIKRLEHTLVLISQQVARIQKARLDYPNHREQVNEYALSTLAVISGWCTTAFNGIDIDGFTIPFNPHPVVVDIGTHNYAEAVPLFVKPVPVQVDDPDDNHTDEPEGFVSTITDSSWSDGDWSSWYDDGLNYF